MRQKNKRRTSHRIQQAVEALEHRQLMAADLVSLMPVDDATNVNPGANLVATFSEAVEPGAGSGNIVIKNAADNSIVEVVNVNDSNKVSFSGAEVTIDPATVLDANTEYYVTVDAGAVKDLGTDSSNQTIFSEDFEGLPLMSSTIVSLDDFVVVMSGTLNVTTAGDYTFGGNSDDGQLLAIDIDQNGLDVFSDDQIIFDDTTHGRQDRLHTCGIETSATSCEDSGEEDAITLAVGEYAFEYWFFERSGGQGGEFFYAPGYHEVFSADDFAVVGDGSKGISVTADGITATTYKADTIQVTDLTAAELLILGEEDVAEGYPVSAAIEFADISGGGRFTNDFAIPSPAGEASEDWTSVPPAGWARDNSDLIEGGAPEYNGFNFLDKDWWIGEQGDQSRTDFELGEGTLLVADPDAHDDFIDNGGFDVAACLNVLEFGPECGLFTASMSTTPIYLNDVAANSAQLSFDSSWWDEDTQSAETRVEYFDSAGNSIGTNVLLRWESMSQSENYKPQLDPDTDINARNEHVEVALENPAEAASMVITFDMPYATNDWWWAIDNVEVSADVTGVSSAPVEEWSFTTGEGGVEFLPEDLDEDGEVGFSDFLILSGAFGQPADPAGSGADIDGSGVVDFADFLRLSGAFGQQSGATAAAAVDFVLAGDDSEELFG